VLEGGEEILVDRIDLAIEGLFAGLVGNEPAALLCGVGQFAEGVGEFEPASINLEALGQARVFRMAARQRRHRQRVIVEDRRHAESEQRLDAFEKNAKEQRLPAIPGMWCDANGAGGLG
jgi:hypothetical protein